MHGLFTLDSDALLGLELSNFEHDRMKEYLGQPPEPASLAGKFPIDNAFCLVGTAAADYPAANGFSRRLVGHLRRQPDRTGSVG